MQKFGLPRAWWLSTVEASREGGRTCASGVSSVLQSDSLGWLTVWPCLSCLKASDLVFRGAKLHVPTACNLDYPLHSWVILAAPNRYTGGSHLVEQLKIPATRGWKIQKNMMHQYGIIWNDSFDVSKEFCDEKITSSRHKIWKRVGFRSGCYGFEDVKEVARLNNR